MILIALGGNIASVAGDARQTLASALAVMPEYGIVPQQVSPFYRTAPVPASDQPWFVNAVARVATALNPPALLQSLLQLEARFGRQRGQNGATANAPRTLDLDLLDFNGLVQNTPTLHLPHPRLHQRAFVLIPLHAIAPDWQHPVTHQPLATLLAALTPQGVEKLG